MENQKYSCQSTDIVDPSKEVTFAEFQCGKSKTGEYKHEIEFEDGSIHREIGLIVNGVFSIRGFFVTKADPDVSLIYIFLIMSCYFRFLSSSC